MPGGWAEAPSGEDADRKEDVSHWLDEGPSRFSRNGMREAGVKRKSLRRIVSAWRRGSRGLEPRRPSEEIRKLFEVVHESANQWKSGIVDHSAGSRLSTMGYLTSMLLEDLDIEQGRGRYYEEIFHDPALPV